MYLCEAYIFNWLMTLLCTPCAGDGMPEFNFCNGSMTSFDGTSSFLPGEDLTITCSTIGSLQYWTSPQFSEEYVLLVYWMKSDTRLDGAMVFNLTNMTDVIPSPLPCTTGTATIANIQESMQGLSLTCSNGWIAATVMIDVIGKLHVVLKLFCVKFYDI